MLTRNYGFYSFHVLSSFLSIKEWDMTVKKPKYLILSYSDSRALWRMPVIHLEAGVFGWLEIGGPACGPLSNVDRVSKPSLASIWVVRRILSSPG